MTVERNFRCWSCSENWKLSSSFCICSHDSEPKPETTSQGWLK